MKNIQISFRTEEQIARHYARIAIRSLYQELALYPKPGLVSFIDSGAHRDMNGQLFFRSLLGLRHYFFLVSLYASQGKPPLELVHLGQEAEKKMFAITGGVNTHKGAIFALGILCATLAKLTVRTADFSLEELQQAIASDWSQWIKDHFQTTHSHGAEVQKKYHLSGARGMAISGYKPIFQIFQDLAQLRITDERLYGLLAFKSLLLSVDDTNVVFRCGIEGLKWARDRIGKAIFLEDPQKTFSSCLDVHKEFSAKNISPGGVADMLGMIFFLKQIYCAPPMLST